MLGPLFKLLEATLELIVPLVIAKIVDVGIAGGDHEALLFSHGKIIRKIPETGIVDELFAEIRKLI